MKKLFIILVVALLSQHTQAQNSPKVGWYINPESGLIFHPDHAGLTLGGSFGFKLFKDHLKLGWQAYGRPGPLNAGQESVLS